MFPWPTNDGRGDEDPSRAEENGDDGADLVGDGEAYVELPSSFHYAQAAYTKVSLDGDSPGRLDERFERVAAILERPPTGPLEEEDYINVSVLVLSEAYLWLQFAQRVERAEQLASERLSRAAYDPYALARGIFRRPTLLGMQELCRRFALPRDDILQGASQGGDLFQAWRPERLEQLQAVVEAVEMLCAVDFRHLLDRMAGQAVPRGSSHRLAEERELCRGVVQTFYEHVLPVAFASLWIWKLFVRTLRNPVENEQEQLILWRLLMQLHSLARTPGELEAHRAVSPLALAGVFGRNIAGTGGMVVSVPFLDMSLTQFWLTLTALLQRTPTLQIGADYHRAVDLLLWRASVLASSAGGRDVFDLPLFSHVPDTALVSETDDAEASVPYLVVNDRFLAETERAFHYLLEASWVASELRTRQVDDYERWEAALTASRAENVHIPARWHETIRGILSFELSVFVRLRLERHAWWHYVYWDEVERYRVKTHAFNVEPRTVMGAARKFDCEIVFDMVNNGITPLLAIYQSAQANESQFEQQEMEEQDRRAAVAAAAAEFCSRTWRLEHGFCWHPPWDIGHAMQDAADRHRDASSSTLTAGVSRFVVEETGEVQYYDEVSKRKLRGDRLLLVQMQESTRRIPAGVLERNILEQYAIGIYSGKQLASDTSVAQKLGTSTSFEVAIRHAVDQIVQLSSVCLSTCGKDVQLTLAGLLTATFPLPWDGTGEDLQGRKGGKNASAVDLWVSDLVWPFVLHHGGLYYVYYGERVYHTSDAFCDAMQIYCWLVEFESRSVLHQLALDLSHRLQQPSDSYVSKRIAADECLQKVLYITGLLPKLLRTIFHLERNTSSGLAEEASYRLPDFLAQVSPCAWDTDAHRRLLRQWLPWAAGAASDASSEAMEGADLDRLLGMAGDSAPRAPRQGLDRLFSVAGTLDI